MPESQVVLMAGQPGTTPSPVKLHASYGVFFDLDQHSLSGIRLEIQKPAYQRVRIILAVSPGRIPRGAELRGLSAMVVAKPSAAVKGKELHRWLLKALGAPIKPINTDYKVEHSMRTHSGYGDHVLIPADYDLFWAAQSGHGKFDRQRDSISVTKPSVVTGAPRQSAASTQNAARGRAGNGFKTKSQAGQASKPSLVTRRNGIGKARTKVLEVQHA